MLPFYWANWANKNLPSGELTFCHGKSPCWMGQSTISMAIFNCKLLVHQRVLQCCLCCKHVLFGHSLGGRWLVYHFWNRLCPMCCIENSMEILIMYTVINMPGTDATNAVGLSFLVGADWNILMFPFSWECHHPNWLSYFSEGLKPPTSNPYQMITLRFINSITSCSPERACM